MGTAQLSPLLIPGFEGVMSFHNFDEGKLFLYNYSRSRYKRLKNNTFCLHGAAKLPRINRVLVTTVLVSSIF